MANRPQLFLAAQGASDWRRELADPERHWKRGRSAFELAVSWHNGQTRPDGLPAEIASLLATMPVFAGATLLLGIVEHKVPLPGGGRPSCNDLWALLRGPEGLVSLAVEGKAGEKFGETVGEWLASARPGSGKPERMRFLVEKLGLTAPVPDGIRYQLLHRAASALLEAERFGAAHAIMLVQSFAEDAVSLEDFLAFARLFGAEVQQGRIATVTRCNDIPLWFAWQDCEPATDPDIAKVV